jgi:hypothetical protein
MQLELAELYSARTGESPFVRGGEPSGHKR